MNFEEFLKGKKVVFVGACPNIIGKGMGSFIDKFDVVVKSGHSWWFDSPEYKRDYGSRCDIVYVNRQYYREMKPFPIMEMKDWKVKWVCLKGCTDQDLLAFNQVIRARKLSTALKKVNQELRSASMGNFIMRDLLDCEPSELYLTGMDFFVSKNPEFIHDNYQEYLDGYLPPKIRNQGNLINIGKKADGHDFYGNAKWFYELFLTNKNLKTDNFIMDVLKGIVDRKINQGEIKWN